MIDQDYPSINSTLESKQHTNQVPAKDDCQLSLAYLRWILSRVRRAIKDFSLIEPNDRIAVGISGGKDSIALLHLLARLRSYRGFNFELIPIHLSLGWEGLGLMGPELPPLQQYCANLNLPLYIEKTQIAEIVFVARQESNPCSLCAKMRRGALHNTALALGCNKVALGHHADDVVETLFLNLFYTGKLGTFSPRTYLSKKNLVLIRPMVYLPERALQSLTRSLNLPIIVNPCPASGQTKRQEMKKIVNFLESRYPDVREKVLTALGNRDLDEQWLRSGRGGRRIDSSAD
ncbi:MAG: tRNA 2-thiocytidine biosynthesis TtcA family protein [Bacillota bacterium]